MQASSPPTTERRHDAVRSGRSFARRSPCRGNGNPRCDGSRARPDRPQLERVNAAIAARDETGLADSIHTLATNLAAHMRHEEKEALPLIARYLGSAGWAEFGQNIRKTQGGLRGGVEYVPWVLDDAPQTARARFLRLLPIPARLLYRLAWSPRYDRTPRWDAAPDASGESLPERWPVRMDGSTRHLELSAGISRAGTSATTGLSSYCCTGS